MPVDPSMAVTGAEWQIAPLGAGGGGLPPAETGTGFGGMLGEALNSLAQSQTEASAGAQSLAAGTAEDPTSVVMAVERAQLSMQLASQIRNKLVEAAQDIFHTQV
jgi:flagellar hook-basal body complex protein FliE